jgi:hypothetical protein
VKKRAQFAHGSVERKGSRKKNKYKNQDKGGKSKHNSGNVLVTPRAWDVV